MSQYLRSIMLHESRIIVKIKDAHSNTCIDSQMQHAGGSMRFDKNESDLKRETVDKKKRKRLHKAIPQPWQYQHAMTGQ